MLGKFDIRKHLKEEGFMIRVMLLIRFDELHFYVRNVWAKYILINGIFTLDVLGEQKLGFDRPPH